MGQGVYVKVLITGGAGFIGHHIVEHILRTTDWDIIIFDRLTYASNGMRRLTDIKAYDDRRVELIPVDIERPISANHAEGINIILHLAAETHVDNSIGDGMPFVMTNVVGTAQMLEFARKIPKLQRFMYFSTDEVFGPAPEGVFYKEWDRYDSRNPYSATKAAGEELCLAWANTYGVPVTISHCMNAFGERQHPEKFVPKIVKKILSGDTIKIHSDPERKHPGQRHYIHCRNIASAVLFILGLDSNRDKFNIVGEREVDNLTLVQMIHGYLQTALKKEFVLNTELVDFHSSRP